MGHGPWLALAPLSLLLSPFLLVVVLFSLLLPCSGCVSMRRRNDPAAIATSPNSYRSTPSSRNSVLEKGTRQLKQTSSPTATSSSISKDKKQNQQRNSMPSSPPRAQDEPPPPPNGVTPELLVDALSGHEDGLLAIAEKLMEQYDKGYDVMVRRAELRVSLSIPTHSLEYPITHSLTAGRSHY